MKATADFTWDCTRRLLLGPGAEAFMLGREYAEKGKKRAGRPLGSFRKKQRAGDSLSPAPAACAAAGQSSPS